MYFGGVTADGGARLLKQAVQAGLNVPFVGPDGIYDGSAATKDSFLNLTGDDAKNSYATAAALATSPAARSSPTSSRRSTARIRPATPPPATPAPRSS
jgi:hypothetical protein